MITIFTIPKPFTDPHIRTIQRNAILSWKKLSPANKNEAVEIILMGDDTGVKETAAEFGVTWWPNIAKNEFGTPLLDSAFEIARKNAKFETMMYVNCDIVFVSDLIDTLPHLPKIDSLTIGRRIDLDITTEIDFSNPAWAEKIKGDAITRGKLHSFAGIDYFIFNKHAFKNLPPFAVGRVGWDNWVVCEARKSLRYTIDATACITAIHQNHGYTGTNVGAARKSNPEAAKNSSFIKNKERTFTIEDANWRLIKNVDGRNRSKNQTVQIQLTRNYFYWLPFLKRYVKRMLSL